jgi:hypothetical protein
MGARKGRSGRLHVDLSKALGCDSHMEGRSRWLCTTWARCGSRRTRSRRLVPARRAGRAGRRCPGSRRSPPRRRLRHHKQPIDLSLSRNTHTHTHMQSRLLEAAAATRNTLTHTAAAAEERAHSQQPQHPPPPHGVLQLCPGGCPTPAAYAPSDDVRRIVPVRSSQSVKYEGL